MTFEPGNTLGREGRPAGAKDREPRKRPLKTKVTNLASLDFLKVDGRTSLGRILLARIREHELQLGRPPSPREAALIERAVHLELRLRAFEAQLRQGEDVGERYLAWTDRLVRVCHALGLRPVAHEVRPLEDYVEEAER